MLNQRHSRDSTSQQRCVPSGLVWDSSWCWLELLETIRKHVFSMTKHSNTNRYPPLTGNGRSSWVLCQKKTGHIIACTRKHWMFAFDRTSYALTEQFCELCHLNESNRQCWWILLWGNLWFTKHRKHLSHRNRPSPQAVKLCSQRSIDYWINIISCSLEAPVVASLK